MDSMICKVCGKEFDPSHHFSGDILREEQMCFNCNFWKNKLIEDAECEPHTVVIIDGTHYWIGPEHSNYKMRGFGGTRFQIEFFDGTKVVTTNLWCQGDIPPEWRDKFPDNARFENNLKWVEIGNTRYLCE